MLYPAKRCYSIFLLAILNMLLLLCLLFLTPLIAFAEIPENFVLEITGDGITNPVSLTLAELETMEQYQRVYSTINTWPTKSWYAGKGVRLRELLAAAKIKEEARLIRFVSSDGYEVTLTVKELFEDERYYFPGLKDNHPHDGSVPGSTKGKTEIEPILALLSAEDSSDLADMNDRDSLLLMFGQRAITEQTNNLFLKRVCKIEVLTAAPEKWDNPKVNIPDGTVVPEGTMLTLSNKQNNEDKIHYTTDGSTPTVNSPIFNWSASRWWPLRSDNLSLVNSPIEIKKDTVIKAITIGPGKEDSEVVTYTFTVDHTGMVADPTKTAGGPPTGITLDRETINLKPGSTFRLAASITPYNAADQQVVWSSSDTRAVVVDNKGLVSVVGPGTAVITAKTVDGGHTATCIVNGPGEDSGQVAAPITDAGLSGGELPENPAKLPEPPAPEPEIGADFGKEKDLLTDESAVVAAGKGDKSQHLSSGQLTRQLPEDERQLPEGKGQYLVEKKDFADSPVFTETGLPGNQSRQVFEVSPSTITFPLQEAPKNLHAYMVTIFFVLFLYGIGKRYAEYIKEQ
ncbi:MAG: hypothetical protein GX996_05510 [Firmicutes bacterium]|nr:hypothetical protein [Bacillota bacterium]